MKKLRGMSVQLLRIMLISGFICISLFFVIRITSFSIIDKYYAGSTLQLRSAERMVDKLQHYIIKNNLSSNDTIKLMSWYKRQPMTFLEIYKDNYLVFNSNYYINDQLVDRNIPVTYYDWYSYYKIRFLDGDAEILIYSDGSYIIKTYITIFSLLLAMLLYYLVILHFIKKQVRYIYILCDEINEMGNGVLEYPITIKGNNELAILASGLNQMRCSLIRHRENEAVIIKKNNAMITSLSHDLRTPLTKLLLYLEIINNKKSQNNAEERSYLDKAYNNGLQIKSISEHLLEYSLTNGDELENKIYKTSFKSAFYDILAEMTDYLSGLSLTCNCNLQWPDINVEVSELSSRRIFDNICSNIEKYAKRDCPIIISTIIDGPYIGFMFQNKKTDHSNNDSHNVGLVTLSDLLAKIKGKCFVNGSNDAFEISVLFHIADS